MLRSTFTCHLKVFTLGQGDIGMSHNWNSRTFNRLYSFPLQYDILWNYDGKMRFQLTSISHEIPSISHSMASTQTLHQTINTFNDKRVKYQSKNSLSQTLYTRCILIANTHQPIWARTKITANMFENVCNDQHVAKLVIIAILTYALAHVHIKLILDA